MKNVLSTWFTHNRLTSFVSQENWATNRETSIKIIDRDSRYFENQNFLNKFSFDKHVYTEQRLISIFVYLITWIFILILVNSKYRNLRSSNESGNSFLRATEGIFSYIRINSILKQVLRAFQTSIKFLTLDEKYHPIDFQRSIFPIIDFFQSSTRIILIILLYSVLNRPWLGSNVPSSNAKLQEISTSGRSHVYAVYLFFLFRFSNWLADQLSLKNRGLAKDVLTLDRRTLVFMCAQKFWPELYTQLSKYICIYVCMCVYAWHATVSVSGPFRRRSSRRFAAEPVLKWINVRSSGFQQIEPRSWFTSRQKTRLCSVCQASHPRHLCRFFIY